MGSALASNLFRMDLSDAFNGNHNITATLHREGSNPECTSTRNTETLLNDTTTNIYNKEAASLLSLTCDDDAIERE